MSGDEVDRYRDCMIYTARIHDPRWPAAGYTGPDGVDITRAGAERHPGGVGVCLAPSRALLDPALALRRLTAGKSPSNVEVSRLVWGLYSAGYSAEMRVSYLTRRPAWEIIIGMATDGDVTVMCQCGDPERCHRSLAARAVAKVGMLEYGGERRDILT